MNINELIAIVKNKLEKNLIIEQIKIDDKSFIHKNHPNNQSDKFHLKLTIKSDYLKKMNKIESSKKIYKILDSEIKKFIHSLQILIS
jgi:BolA protein